MGGWETQEDIRVLWQRACRSFQQDTAHDGQLGSTCKLLKIGALVLPVFHILLMFETLRYLLVNNLGRVPGKESSTTLSEI